MEVILLIVGIIHAVMFILTSVRIHEDHYASSIRKFFAFSIAFCIPILGPLISNLLVAEPIPVDSSGGTSSYDGGNYTSGGGTGGGDGGCG